MQRYEPALDVERLVALDVHVHIWSKNEEVSAVQAAARRHFRSAAAAMSLDETADYYRARTMACAVFGTDPRSPRTWVQGAPNEEVLEAARRHPDVLIPFASLDPWRGQEACDDARRLIDVGVRGFKFHPPAQAFFPNDERVYPLYQVIEAAERPALFHTGQSGIGAGMPGGGGMRQKYGNPMALDDVAVDFPRLPIILAHPSFPWQDEALAVAVHKPTVYIDLSGWSPKYFPPQLVHYANTLLKEKVLFGSDHPLITPDRWLADFTQAPFRDAVRPLILKQNALRLFGFA